MRRFLLCVSFFLGFFWLTVTGTCKPNKPIFYQLAFGHGTFHSNRKETRAPAEVIDYKIFMWGRCSPMFSNTFNLKWKILETNSMLSLGSWMKLVDSGTKRWSTERVENWPIITEDGHLKIYGQTRPIRKELPTFPFLFWLLHQLIVSNYIFYLYLGSH